VFLVGQECTHSDVLTPQLSTDPISETVNMALLDLCGKVARAPGLCCDGCDAESGHGENVDFVTDGMGLLPAARG